MKNLRLLVLLLASTLLLAGVAACGGDDDTTSDTTVTASVNVTASPDAGDDDDDTTDDDDDSDDGDDTDGDDDGGDDDYYNLVATILNQADRDSNDIALQYGGPYDDTADEIDQTKSAFTETGQVLETVLLDLSTLNPPAEAEDAHQAYFDSVQEATMLFAEALAELEDVSTAAELTAYQDERGPGLNAASAGIEDQCLVLQGLADSSGSGADLGCTVQD